MVCSGLCSSKVVLKSGRLVLDSSRDETPDPNGSAVGGSLTCWGGCC